MSEFADFIAARLDEDEATAKAAADHGEGTWRMGIRPDEDIQFIVHDSTMVRGGAIDEDTLRHIARHDPARVLREVTAKRAILAEHHPSPIDPEWCARCHEPIPDAREDADSCCPLDWPCPTLRAMAAAWSDHPDYRAEWAPAL